MAIPNKDGFEGDVTLFDGSLKENSDS